MRIFFGLLFMAFPMLTSADVEVKAWARATTPGSSSAAIYGVFKNTGAEVMSFSKINFAGARQAMIHETREEQGVLRMTRGSVILSPGESYELKPGGTHLMLMGISSPLIEGCRYSFQVVWDNGESSAYHFLTGGYGQMRFPKNGNQCP